MDCHDVAKMENIAYVMGMAAGAIIEAMGMAADNAICVQKSKPLKYTGEDFKQIMEDREMHHNGILTNLRR